ncbi:hypothetical protein ACSNOI_22415 [Actinomadura kijaniata]
MAERPLARSTYAILIRLSTVPDLDNKRRPKLTVAFGQEIAALTRTS